jgi:hypothetical protein
MAGGVQTGEHRDAALEDPGGVAGGKHSGKEPIIGELPA